MHIYLCEYVILAVNNLNIFRAWLALKIPSRRWLGKANVGGSRRLVGKRNADQQVDTEVPCMGMFRPTEGWSVKVNPICQFVGKKRRSVKKYQSVKKKSVGKDLLVVSNYRSANICRSGKAFADRTYGDRLGWSAIHIPNRLSVNESGISNQLVCWQYNAVV
jgi:hypothetical protein